MTLKHITVIVLRLFSLYWFVSSVGLFASVAATLMPTSSATQLLWCFAAPMVLFILAVVVFLLSYPIARFVTPPSNDTLSLQGLSLYQLYCFAFTFLGLYFVLSSVADSLNWLHYFFIVNHTSQGIAAESFTGYYKLSRSLITLIAGGLVIIAAPRCAGKLAEIQSRLT